MAFVATEGQIQKLSRLELPPNYNLRLTDDFTRDYAAIWRTQGSVRTSVSFLARNIASLGLHTFRRKSDTDRERLTDHPLSRLLSQPNPYTTCYRLMSALVHDLGIYDTAYWLKVETNAGLAGILRLQPQMVTPKGGSWIAPEYFEVRGQTGVRDIPRDQIVHFRGYSPEGEMGAPPIEALRQVLAEEWEAGRMRSQVLRNGARTSGYITRPAGAQWSDGARERFRESFKSQYTGGGPSAGGTPILEDGMTFEAAAQTAEQLQYIEARKLTREEVASAFFIPPPMVGLLDNASFSNITEQHKMLYQDTLGPWLSMITQEIALQLMPDLPDTDNVYVEFNLQEKLNGSFEEQAEQLQSATGAPYMLRSEARARLNLPEVGGMDEPIIPLNVLIGGQASPTDSAPKARAGLLTDPAEIAAAFKGALLPAVKERAPESYTEQTKQVLTRFFDRQGKAVLSALGAKADPDWWDAARWDKELSDDLYRLAVLTTGEVAKSTLDRLGIDAEKYDTDRTLKFLKAVATSRAGMINATTRDQVKAAIDADDTDRTPAKVFDIAKSDRAISSASALVTTFSAFATTEAVSQVAGDKATKTWNVGSANPRPSHASMDGETVGISETFSNGMNWPGDPAGGADEVAGCTCDVTVDIG